MSKLAGKVALVTGGANGIGKDVCTLLRSHGIKVCIADMDVTHGEETMKELQVKFGDPKAVIFQKVDVTNEKMFEAAMVATKSTFGRLDIVINNAGIASFDWRAMININLIGVIIGTELAFKHIANDKGKKDGTMIINTASIVGIDAMVMAPGYTASKHGCAGWTKCWGHPTNVEKTGVKVNAVCPEAADTALIRNLADSGEKEDQRTQLHQCINSSTLLTTAKVAEAFLKLLQEEVTGHLLVVSAAKGFYYSPYNTYY